MNRLHVVTHVQELAIEGITEPGEVYRLVRNRLSEQSTSLEDFGLKRTEVEKLAKEAVEMVGNAHFPIERRRLELDLAEGKIRADILDALKTIDISNPNIAREVYEAHRSVGASAGAVSLRHGMDCLEGANVDVTSLKAAIEALFPSEPEDKKELSTDA